VIGNRGAPSWRRRRVLPHRALSFVQGAPYLDRRHPLLAAAVRHPSLREDAVDRRLGCRSDHRGARSSPTDRDYQRPHLYDAGCDYRKLSGRRCARTGTRIPAFPFGRRGREADRLPARLARLGLDVRDSDCVICVTCLRSRRRPARARPRRVTCTGARLARCRMRRRGLLPMTSRTGCAGRARGRARARRRRGGDRDRATPPANSAADRAASGQSVALCGDAADLQANSMRNLTGPVLADRHRPRVREHPQAQAHRRANRRELWPTTTWRSSAPRHFPVAPMSGAGSRSACRCWRCSALLIWGRPGLPLKLFAPRTGRAALLLVAHGAVALWRCAARTPSAGHCCRVAHAAGIFCLAASRPSLQHDLMYGTWCGAMSLFTRCAVGHPRRAAVPRRTPHRRRALADCGPSRACSSSAGTRILERPPGWIDCWPRPRASPTRTTVSRHARAAGDAQDPHDVLGVAVFCALLLLEACSTGPPSRRGTAGAGLRLRRLLAAARNIGRMGVTHLEPTPP